MKRLFITALACAAILVACGDDNNNPVSNGGDSPSSPSNPSTSTTPSGSSFNYGTLTDDRDGQTYKTIKIGEQTWMAENLRYEVPTGNSAFYENNPNSKYGRLYTWAGAVGKTNDECGFGHLCELSGRVQGACPTGWHLPSREELEMLVAAVGDTSDAGTKLKSKSGWDSEGNGTDEFGFSMVPAGYIGLDETDFHQEGTLSDLWSSTEDSAYDVYAMHFYSTFKGVEVELQMKTYGYSIRCVKDE